MIKTYKINNLKIKVEEGNNINQPFVNSVGSIPFFKGFVIKNFNKIGCFSKKCKQGVYNLKYDNDTYTFCLEDGTIFLIHFLRNEYGEYYLPIYSTSTLEEFRNNLMVREFFSFILALTKKEYNKSLNNKSSWRNDIRKYTDLKKMGFEKYKNGWLDIVFHS